MIEPNQPVSASSGKLRAGTPAERAASRTDADLIEQFLRERCSRSQHTEASYRSQLRRLGWFCMHIGLRSIREFERSHWSDFVAYLKDPPDTHVMGASVGFTNPGWRPFRGPLTDRSAKQAEIVARGFFGWLADPAIGAIPIDPVGSIRTHSARRSATAQKVQRYLNDVEWDYVQAGIAAMPTDRHVQIRTRARARWVMALAILTGLRASEIAAARRKDIVAADAPGTFVLHIVRKGGVEAELLLHSQVIVAWRNHLEQYGEDASPPDGDAPLVLPIRDADLKPPVTGPGRAHIWRIVKDVMLAAADLAGANGDSTAEARLRSASTHWLRHSFGTRLMRAGANVVSARDLLDHASFTTTNQYLHSSDKERRADLEKLDVKT